MTAPDNSAKWAEYVRRRTQGIDRKVVAAAADVSTSHLGRWMDGTGGFPKAEKVIAFARALHLPPKEALVAAGYLKRDEADAVIEAMESLDEVPDAELLHQLSVRLAERPSRPQVDDVSWRLSTADED